MPHKAPTRFKRKDVYGLSPKDYPRHIRAYVDQDYLDDLPADAKAYLAEFNEKYYGATFDTPPEEGWSPEATKELGLEKSRELRKKSYRARNAANRGDAYGVAVAGHSLVFKDKPIGDDLPTNPDQDLRPTPKYLDSEEYKQAVQAYRSAISAKADPSTLAKLRRRVEIYTHEVTKDPAPRSRKARHPRR